MSKKINQFPLLFRVKKNPACKKTYPLSTPPFKVKWHLPCMVLG